MNASGTLRIAALERNLIGRPGELRNSIYYRVGEIIGQSLGMSYELIPSVDGEFGRLLPDGNWTGTVGMLLNNLADVIIEIVPTEERRKVLDFTPAYEFKGTIFFTQKPEIVGRTFAFVKPFTGYVWLALILSLFAVSFMFHMLSRGRYSLDVVIFNLFRSLLQQSSGLCPTGYVSGCLHMIWVVGMVLLAYFYSAVLLSFFSFPTRSGIKDISDLAKAVAMGTHQCKTYPGSFISHELLKSEKESFRLIGQNLLKNNDHDFDPVEILKNKKMAIVVSDDIFGFLRERYYASEDAFLHITKAMAFRKNFCCSEKLKDVLLRDSAAGLTSKILKDWYFRRELPFLIKPEQDKTIKRLSLGDLWGAFAVLVSGHAFAFIAFAFEIASHKKRRTRRLQSKCCPLRNNRRSH